MIQARALTSGTFYLTLMQASQYITLFIFYIMVARFLSPGEVGSFSLLLMILAVFNTLTLLALNNAVIKYVSEGLGSGDEDYALSSSWKAFKIILATSIPALTLGFLISPVISTYVGTGVLEVLSILTSAFILNLTSYYGALMYGYSMFREVSLQNIIYTFSCRFIGLTLALTELRILGLSLGFLIGSTITLIYSIWVLRWRIKYLSRVFPSLTLLKFSMPIYGANIIGLIQSWLDVAILSSITDLNTTGTYYIAVASITPLSILWQPLSSALFPTLSWINGSGRRDEVLELSMKALRIVTAIVLPLSLGLASIPKTALSIVYGEKYAGASIPFTILSSTTILAAYTSIYNVKLQSVGKTKPILTAGIASTATYITLLSSTIILKQIGAAIARAIMTAIGFIILHREAEVKIPGNLKRSIVVALIIVSTLTPIELLLKSELYTKALVEAAVLIASLSITFKLLKPLSSQEIEVIKSIIPWKPKH